MSFWSQTRMDTKCGKTTVGIAVPHNSQRSLPIPDYSFYCNYILRSLFLKLRNLWSKDLHKLQVWIKIQQMQQYADIYSLQNYSTYFGCHSTHRQEY